MGDVAKIGAVLLNPVAAIGTIAGASAVGVPQLLEARKQTKLQADGNKVSRANQEVANIANRRAAARAERIRRARILQASSTLGTVGSSGEAGAVGALTTNFASQVAQVSGQTQTADFLSGLNQQVANSQQRAGVFDAIGNASKFIFTAAGGFSGDTPAKS